MWTVQNQSWQSPTTNINSCYNEYHDRMLNIPFLKPPWSGHRLPNTRLPSTNSWCLVQFDGIYTAKPQAGVPGSWGHFKWRSYLQPVFQGCPIQHVGLWWLHWLCWSNWFNYSLPINIRRKSGYDEHNFLLAEKAGRGFAYISAALSWVAR